ncbi:MAG: VTT domain-containing protein [Bacteroidales bacterium]
MRFLRIVIIIIILLVLGGFFYFTFDNDPQQILLESFGQWDTRYLLIIFVVFALTLVSTLTGLPVLYLSVALGFFLKFLPAFLFAWAINLIAVMATYIVVKRVYYNYFKEKFGKKKLIKGINKRIKKYGFWTITFSRGVYFIPTNLINFSFPLSKITARQYLTGTMTGLIPECLVNVSTGYLLRHELQLMGTSGQPYLRIIITGTTLAMLATLLILLRYRRKRLDKARLNKFVPLLDES